MKTLEFKAYLTPRQTEKVESWLKAMRWVWNKGLALLNEYSHHYFFDKRFKEAYRCCYVGWEYHWTKDGDEWKPERPYCSLYMLQRSFDDLTVDMSALLKPLLCCQSSQYG